MYAALFLLGCVAIVSWVKDQRARSALEYQRNLASGYRVAVQGDVLRVGTLEAGEITLPLGGLTYVGMRRMMTGDGIRSDMWQLDDFAGRPLFFPYYAIGVDALLEMLKPYAKDLDAAAGKRQAIEFERGETHYCAVWWGNHPRARRGVVETGCDRVGD